MKKLVVKLDLEDDKAKQKALKTVSTLQGIDAISVDMKERKLTVIGTVDPVNVVSKLRKYWHTDIVTVGPAKEPEKKEEAKSNPAEEPKKDGGQDPAAAGAKTAEQQQQESSKKEGEGGEEGKKEGEAQGKKQGGGDQGKKGEGEKTREGIVYNYDPVLELARAYRAYNPHMTSYYYVQSMEENPNACVIS